MSHVSTEASHRVTAKITFGLGFIVACWNFVLMFRGWVVAPQSEIVGANILFVFLGVAPGIGMAAAVFKKRWGAWTVLISPVIALTGLIFTKNTEWMQVFAVMAMTVAPTVILGAILVKMVVPPTPRSG